MRPCNTYMHSPICTCSPTKRTDTSQLLHQDQNHEPTSQTVTVASQGYNCYTHPAPLPHKTSTKQRRP